MAKGQKAERKDYLDFLFAEKIEIGKKLSHFRKLEKAENDEQFLNILRFDLEADKDGKIAAEFQEWQRNLKSKRIDNLLSENKKSN